MNLKVSGINDGGFGWFFWLRQFVEKDDDGEAKFIIITKIPTEKNELCNCDW